jgi:lipopolysaccharide transport system permease protein
MPSKGDSLSDRTIIVRNAIWLNAAYELWDYRELFYYFAWRDVKVRYKQTVLGALWAIIQPLTTMLIFTVLFGRVANIPSDGIPKPLFYLSALVPWTYFSTTVSTISLSLTSNSELLTKIYFPRLILPSSVAVSGMMDFMIASTLVIGFLLYYGIDVTAAMWLWPLFVVALVLLALGVGMLLAALNVKYRDIKYAVPFGIQLWLFITPIIYPASSIPEGYRWMFYINPLTGIIEGIRHALVPAVPIHWAVVSFSLGMTILTFIGAALFFNRSAKDFADYV